MKIFICRALFIFLLVVTIIFAYIMFIKTPTIHNGTFVDRGDVYGDIC